MEEKVIQLKDLQPGSSYLVRARAINRYDVASEWSETYTLNIVKDDLKPSVPAAPTVNLAGPQKVVVIHDNKKKLGGDLEFDVVAYKVFTNTTQSNTGGTLIHTMSATRPGSGIDSFATINVNAPLSGDNGATVYFYVTAVDSAGNESDPSDATTGKPIQYFDSAYISDLTADKIRTGTLQANQQISVGTLAPIVIKSNAASPRGQIYVGTTSNPTGADGSGYKDPQTAFYVDSTGKFSLKDKLYWDGTTLTIDGYFQIGDEETTISGNQIRSGHLISNNYISNISGQPDAQSDYFTNRGTWIDLEHGSIYSESFYITGTGDVDSDGNPIDGGTAVFKGELFASRGIFSDFLSTQLGYELSNPQGLRFPTLVVESTNTNDGYLVLFKNAGTNSGIEFYVKQGPETAENNQVNWRRGSLSHLSGPNWPGGVLRLAAYSSSTGATPGRLHIYAEGSNQPGEIHLDADRVYVSDLWIKEDFGNENLSNFWKDPDTVTSPQRFFLLGSALGSAIEVRKKADGTPQVKIKNYEMEGTIPVIDDSKITVNTVEIGKGVGGAGKHGIKIDNNNYWYDPATLNSSDIVFRAGGSAADSLTVRKNGSVEFEGTTNPTGGEIKGILLIKNVAAQTTFSIGRNVIAERDGIKLNDNNYWTLSQTGLSANFRVGGNSRYLEWTGTALNISTDSITISGDPAATQAFASSTASTAANNAVASFSLVDKWNGSITGVRIQASGIIQSIFGGVAKTYGSATNGWILDNSSSLPRFDIGNSTYYLRWSGTGLNVRGAVDAGTTIPGGSLEQSGGDAGSGMQIGSNKIIVTDGYGGGTIAFTDGATPTPGQLGSISPSSASKFSGLEGGRGIILGNSAYPFIEIGKNNSSENKILLLTGANVGLEIRPSNFILRGGSSSRVTGIPESGTATKFLAKNADNWLIWTDAVTGGGGTTYTAGVGIDITASDTIRNTGYRMAGSTTGGTRVSDTNRIGFVNAPSNPEDGDMWVQF